MSDSDYEPEGEDQDDEDQDDDQNEAELGDSVEGSENPIVFITAEALPLERRRLDDDPELAPDAAIIGTFLRDHLISRSIADPEWSPEADMGLLSEPRHLSYAAHEIEGQTIRAELSAVIPASAIPREPWQPEPEEGSPPALFPLGVVVRIPADRTGAELPIECFMHFQAILQGASEPVADRILRRL